MHRAARTAVALGLGALAVWSSACGRSHGVTFECQRDEDCDVGHGCSGGTCLPLATAPSTWAVELAPLSSSESGLAELESTPAPLELSAPDKRALAATVSAELGAAPPVTAHVVLTIPPVIPGRPDLQLETDLVAPVGAATASTFTLSPSDGLMGRTGTLRILPAGLDALTHAPASLTLKVDPTLSLVIPSKTFTIQGRLRTAVDDPKVGQIARAFQAGALVSNVDVTAPDGSFTLTVPAARAGPAPSQAIIVELTPPSGQTSSEPSFASKAFWVTANVDLGDVRLPAFSQPNIFRFAVRAGTDSGPAVPGTIVHARTQLANDATGTTTFLREGVAGDKGQADLALLPGSTMLQNYEVAVVPPTDSPYATRCIAKLPLAAGGTLNAPAILPAVVLQRRTIVGRTVLTNDNTPVAGVMVVATRVANDLNLPCTADVTTRPTTATTDAQGRVSLLLDPGTYRFDYDPPAGAPVPRLTETPVPVSSSATTSQIASTIVLPPAALVEGTARDALGRPLPLAAVRLFEVVCTGPETCTGPGRVPPVLRGEGRTDAAGHFHAVIAVSPTAHP